MAKGIENRARSPPAVFDFATSQIQKHGGTKMYYDLVESGKRIKALRKEHGLTQEQLAEVSLLIWQSNWLCALRQPLITYF